MRAASLLCAVVLVGLGASCEPMCNERTCGGCCDATGICRMGDEAPACGIGGASCAVCQSAEVCADATCVAAPPVGGGGQSGGGAATGGGGSATGGGGVTGGGSATGGGAPQPTTCASNVRWTLGAIGNGDMNPGLACRSCHSGTNFQDQNPDAGHVAPFYVYRFMGTAFPALHEEDLCDARPPEATVEILDLDGGVVTSMRVRYPSGNFYSVAMPGSSTQPYRARIISGGRVREMLSRQTNGDCNSCHTEQGRNGAPGRVLLPE